MLFGGICTTSCRSHAHSRHDLERLVVGNLNRGIHQSLVPMGLDCHWPSRPPAASNHQPPSNQPVSCHQVDSKSTDSDKTWMKSLSRLYPCLGRAFMMSDANDLAGQGDPRHPTHC